MYKKSFHGIGSYPPLLQGLHLKILLIVKKPPFSGPYLFIASIPYLEHEGENLQLDGKKGEINLWYIFIILINKYLNILGISSLIFIGGVVFTII
tara:strand:+ start:240 stop:524 length:285 start_codon:yes stop_codon:yes gene_type:complete